MLACRIDSRHLSQIQKLLQRKTHCFLFSVLSRLIAAGNGFLTYLQMCTLVCSHAGPWGVSRASLSHRSVSICIVFPGHVPLGMPPCPLPAAHKSCLLTQAQASPCHLHQKVFHVPNNLPLPPPQTGEHLTLPGSWHPLSQGRGIRSPGMRDPVYLDLFCFSSLPSAEPAPTSCPDSLIQACHSHPTSS